MQPLPPGLGGFSTDDLLNDVLNDPGLGDVPHFEYAAPGGYDARPAGPPILSVPDVERSMFWPHPGQPGLLTTTDTRQSAEQHLAAAMNEQQQLQQHQQQQQQQAGESFYGIDMPEPLHMPAPRQHPLSLNELAGFLYADPGPDSFQHLLGQVGAGGGAASVSQLLQQQQQQTAAAMGRVASAPQSYSIAPTSSGPTGNLQPAASAPLGSLPGLSSGPLSGGLPPAISAPPGALPQLGGARGPSPMLAALQQVRQLEATTVPLSTASQQLVPPGTASTAAVVPASIGAGSGSDGTHRQSNSESPTNTSGQGAMAPLAVGVGIPAASTAQGTAAALAASAAAAAAAEAAAAAARPKRTAARNAANKMGEGASEDDDSVGRGGAGSYGGGSGSPGPEDGSDDHHTSGPDGGSGGARRATVGRPRQKKSYDSLIDPNLPPDEIRRLRRMLSNRESARRSRRRRQTHLQTLEQQLDQMRMENDAIRSELDAKQIAIANVTQEKHALQAELEALRRQLVMQQANALPSTTGGSGGLSAALTHGLAGLGAPAGAGHSSASGLPPSMGLPFTMGLAPGPAPAPGPPRQLGLKGTRPPSLHQLVHEEQALQQQKRHAGMEGGGPGAGAGYASGSGLPNVGSLGQLAAQLLSGE